MNTVERSLSDVEMESKQPYILLSSDKKVMLGEQIDKGVNILLNNPDYVVMLRNVYFDIIGKRDISNVASLLAMMDEEQESKEVLKINDDIELPLKEKLADGVHSFIANFEYVVMSKVTYFDVVMMAKK